MTPEQLIAEALNLSKHLSALAIVIALVVIVRKMSAYKEEMNPINRAMEAYNADCNRVSRLIDNAEEKDRMALYEKIEAIGKQYADKLPERDIKMGVMGLKAKLEVRFREREGIVTTISKTVA